MRHRHENVTLQPHQLLRMPHSNGSSVEPAPTVEVSKLSYAFQDGSPGLQDINLKLPPQSRTLLIGGMLSRPLPVLPTISALGFPQLLQRVSTNFFAILGLPF